MKTPIGTAIGSNGRFSRTDCARICRAIGVALFAVGATFARGQASLYDPSFDIGQGVGGLVNSILVQDDGRILVGMDTPASGRPTNSMYLARFLSDGNVDPSFELHPDGSVSRLLKQPDGKILVSGSFGHLGDLECHGLARLLTNDVVDPNFNANGPLTTNDHIWAIALQPDGKILAGIYGGFRVVRLEGNGEADPSWTATNLFSGFVHSFLSRPDGSILVGGAFQSVNGFACPGLALLDSTGHLDLSFDPRLETNASVFSFARDDQGNVLLGGRFVRQGLPGLRLLARLKPDLQWDDGFSPNEFTASSNLEAIRSVLLQPDGKIVVGGLFYEVGGYWRRHLARLDSQGRVDPCFDPGLGLGDTSGPYGANALARQADGRVVVGGNFHGFDGHLEFYNLVRVLPESDCNATRMHLGWYSTNSFYVAGTCTPGGTNFLQISSNLVEWINRSTTTQPYVYLQLGPPAGTPAFFRVKKVF